MSHIYDQRKRPQKQSESEPERTAAPGPDFSALMTGAALPSAAQKGRSIDLDAAIKAKMEHAFGDLSAVKFYESPAVGQAGAEAIAQGNEIAFAPGMTDFSTRSGQERLGHELSHVMSRRSGAVRGTGFLANPSLEARADREGALAAAGEAVYTGPVTSALSSAGPGPAAGGAMQAKRGGGRSRKNRRNGQQSQRPIVTAGAPSVDLKGPDSASMKIPTFPMMTQGKPPVQNPGSSALGGVNKTGGIPKRRPKKKPTKPIFIDDGNDLSLTQSNHSIPDNIISNDIIPNDDTGSNNIISSNDIIPTGDTISDNIISNEKTNDISSGNTINEINQINTINKINEPDEPKSSFLTTDLSKIDRTKGIKTSFLKKDQTESTVPPELREVFTRLSKKYSMGYRGQWNQSLHRPAGKGKIDKNGKLVKDAPVEFSGLVPSRIFANMESHWGRGRGFTMKPEELEEMFDNLMAPHKASPEELAEEKEDAENTKNMKWSEKKAYQQKMKKIRKPHPVTVSEEANRKFDKGIMTYKKILYDDLLHLEKKYGTLMTQMHPEDVLPQLDEDDYKTEMASNQDVIQMELYGKRYFDPKNKEDQHFHNLNQYYTSVGNTYNAYKGLSLGMIDTMSKEEFSATMESMTADALETEDKVNGPHMNETELKRYLEDSKKLPKREKRAFGRFK